ncbi:hypothetical protein HWI79_3465 [Cryptosporidium felis]|nr:hypothetical protein HWI79_3465 [Cryptosporidium felis]
METTQKSIFDKHKYNSSVFQRLKSGGNQRKDVGSDDSEAKLEGIYREISLRNESNALKMVLNREVLRFSKQNKFDATFRFLILAYSKLFLALIQLKRNCELEEINVHTMELKKLNFIFKNCSHFRNFKVFPLDKRPMKQRSEGSGNVSPEIAVYIEKKDSVKEKGRLMEKMESLNNSVNDLKSKIRMHFSINVKEGLLEADQVLNSHKNEPEIDLKSITDSSTRDTPDSSDPQNGESDEPVEVGELSTKNTSHQEKSKKITFCHRRSIETISFAEIPFEEVPPMEFSPAPKYHSRSRTLSINHPHEEQLFEYQNLPSGKFLNRPLLEGRPKIGDNLRKIIESSNFNHKFFVQSNFQGI